MKDFKGIKIDNKETPKEFQGIKWVAKIINKEASFANIKYLLFEDGYWIATDGQRLHIYATNYKYEEHLYEVVINNRSRIVLKITGIPISNYPEWRDVSSGKMIKEIALSLYDFSCNYTKLVREIEDTSDKLGFIMPMKAHDKREKKA